MNFHILTLFPEMVMNGLSTSITGRAMEQGKIKIEAINIRDFSKDKHKRVDDYIYGGGAGMLMQPDPVYEAWKSIQNPEKKKSKIRTIYVTPQGQPFHQKMAEEFAKEEQLIFLCGHYEGIDERVLEEVVTDYVSIGDYVLTGGELAAMVMVDAIARLTPGVLHNDLSAETESFHGNLLEYPQYTRPESWHDKTVPKILQSGNQRKIEEWRLEQSEQRTKERRPDLYAQYEKLQACKGRMQKQKLLHMDMIQLIDRGNAELLYDRAGEILLKDKRSGLYFHTNLGTEERQDPAQIIKFLRENVGTTHSGFVFHQESMATRICKEMRMRITCKCHQGVWTRKEKLPITGLYRADGKPMERGKNQGLVIRQLGTKYAQTVVEHYHLVDEPDYIMDRLKKGALYGAFYAEQDEEELSPDRLLGFIGYHEEGSIGMLEVFPEYKKRGLAMALETYMLNLTLERGWIPYGQIIVGNEASMALQQKLGLCISRECLFWAESEKKS